MRIFQQRTVSGPLWKALAVTLVAVAFVAGACAGGGGMTRQTPPTVEPLGDDTENVGIIEQGDKIILRGHLFGRRNEVGVILAHMKPSDQSAWFDFAETLAENGYAALTFDFRGYGETGGDVDYDKLDEDLTAAVQFMRSRGKTKVFLVGASMGGTASLVVAAREDVDGVVAVSAPSRFDSQDALAAVPEVTVPKLFIASEGDMAAMVALEELFSAAGEPKEQQILPGDEHGTDIFMGDAAAAARDAILQFLERYSD